MELVKTALKDNTFVLPMLPRRVYDTILRGKVVRREQFVWGSVVRL